MELERRCLDFDELPEADDEDGDTPEQDEDADGV